VGKNKNKNLFSHYLLTSKMGTRQLKYLSGGQNKNKNLFWNKILF
jgi:hypothetical protein